MKSKDIQTHSDTTAIASDTTAIASDTTAIASDTTVIASVSEAIQPILVERSEEASITSADSDTLTPAHIIQSLDRLAEQREAAGQKVIRVTEVGQNQLWAAQYSHITRPRSFLTSGGLGAMGFGLPAAIGAQIAHPDALVLNISGDGSFQMNVQELATAVAEQLPIKIIVLNNAGLGLVRQWQNLLYEGRTTASNLAPDIPDIPALAQAYGALGLRATTPAHLATALAQALATPKVAVIDCRISPAETVEALPDPPANHQ